MGRVFHPRRWSPEEVAEALRLWRDEGLSYLAIGRRLGRNHSSVGYVIRREDLAEEARLAAAEEAEEFAYLSGRRNER